jgi:hypothetical protein
MNTPPMPVIFAIECSIEYAARAALNVDIGRRRRETDRSPIGDVTSAASS